MIPTTLIHRPENYFRELDLGSLYSVERPLEVELGSGDGSFLANYAAIRREVNFMGVERLLGRLRKLDRKARRGMLDNVRLLRIEASYFIEYMLPCESVWGIHIYFPDPWPKRRHHKNRLVNVRFPAIAKRALKPGGVVYLRTDDRNYFEQMVECFGGAGADFESVETPGELQSVVTDFERNFNAKGVPTLRAAYRRRMGPATTPG